MELKEAIIYIHKRREYIKRHLNNYEKRECTGAVYYELGQELKAFETVLQALEEKDNEIAKLNFYVQAEEQQHEYDVKMIDDVKGKAVELYKIIDERETKIKELEADLYSANQIISDYIDTDRENELLKKQIELMAEYINEGEEDYCMNAGDKAELPICDYMRVLTNCDVDCKDCIKQYFEQKAKGVDFDAFEKEGK